MSSLCSCFILLFYILLILESSQISRGREISKQAMDDHLQIYDDKKKLVDDHQMVLENHVHHDHLSIFHMDHLDPSAKIFFTVNDMKIGKKIPIYFPIKEPSKTPPLLSREEANPIPFSLEKLEYLLEFFSLSKDSPQAKVMEMTLSHCEAKPIKGETKFCATSFESMLDWTRGIFGLDTQFKVLATTHITISSNTLQNYTVLEVPKVILAPKVVGCHTMPYPYAIYYCHCQESDNKLFEVSLGGESTGERVKAMGICHMDTSHWDPDHVSFRVLGTKPGQSPVCHFFPADNLLWVATVSV